jgi:hypothetical protein
LGNRRVQRAKARNLAAETVILLFGELDEPEQRIRHPAASGQNDGLPPRRLGFDEGSNASEAIGIGNARSAKLVDNPRVGLAHRGEVSRQKKRVATVLTRSRARNCAASH